MTRIMVAALVIAVGAPLLAGCVAPPNAPAGATYAPYDEESNPFCGALGTCAPLDTRPYPMHGNSPSG